MGFSEADLMALGLTLRLASVVTFILLIIGTPIAWWLSQTQSWLKGPVSAIVALPLILPPTVIGFYLLIFMGPSGWLGQLTHGLGLGSLAFTFWGLVLASVIYSLPFVVQPIQNAIEALGPRPLEVAATLRAGPWDTFFHVVLPMAKPGFVTAAVLGFAHTVGEFGVVLMIGGNIPGVTQVVSVQIYDHVDALQYNQAHWLSFTLIVFSFVVLACVYWLQRGRRRFGGKYVF
ncbi:MAG: molybdate ABC transporter permease subunit [Pseudomonadales bacterium]|nr:molybdate ABC transporter permease subunit [Pseudomonadales bacterium]